MPLGPIEDRGSTARTGTRLSFVPDFAIFARRTWDLARVAERGRELAALHPRVTLIVQREAFRYPGGPVDCLRHLAGDDLIAEPFQVARLHRGIAIECAIGWADREAEAVLSFVNWRRTFGGGTHVTGMFAALRRVFGRRATALRQLDSRAFRSRIGRGMIAVLTARLEEPQLSPTANHLQSPEAEPAVREVVEPALAAHLARDPALLDAVLVRIGV